MEFLKMHIRLTKGVLSVGIKTGNSGMHFFFDHPDIADQYGFVTCYSGPDRIYLLGFEK